MKTLIIYEMSWLVLYTWLSAQSEKQLLEKIGTWGENILTVLFFPNIFLFALWFYNWDCESNNLN